MNLLGQRDNTIYGDTTLSELETRLQQYADKLQVGVKHCQSNDESSLVDFVQREGGSAHAVILNPAALSKVGYPLLDALIDSNLPVVEVHISNVMAREQFRQESIFSKFAIGTICGLGVDGYIYALQFLADKYE